MANHDMVLSKWKYDQKNLHEIFWNQRKQECSLPNVKFHEGIVLENIETKQELSINNGHLLDFYEFLVGWKINRFLVRILETIAKFGGIKDPNKSGEKIIELIKVERRIKKWIADNGK
jgi:hypothetical protein